MEWVRHLLCRLLGHNEKTEDHFSEVEAGINMPLSVTYCGRCKITLRENW